MSADDRTPVDEFLQARRPLLDRAAARGDGRLGRVRQALWRATGSARRERYGEQVGFEASLREAIAHLARQAEDERRAREAAERQIDALRARADGVDDALRAIHYRLRLIEARQRGDAIERTLASASESPAGPAPAAGSPPPLDDFDYLAFEDRFRGPEDLVRQRQAAHADRFTGIDGVVADLGCGRGELLELLRERGVDAVGVDASAEMVAIARAKGLQAEHGDMFAFLAARAPGSVAGVICSHVVEHLWPADHVRLTRLLARALRPGGMAIIETPNPKSLIAGAVNFSCDPTHLRPVFPETLAFMLERAGFEKVDVEYLSPVPADQRAEPVIGADDDLADLVAQINRSLSRLDALVFGDRDYAIVARRGKDATESD